MFLSGTGDDEEWQSSFARILMSSEQRVPQLESLATLIKVRGPAQETHLLTQNSKLKSHHSTKLLQKGPNLPAGCWQQLQHLGRSELPAGITWWWIGLAGWVLRCSGWVAQVPPLRVRPGDVADMARYFVRQAARRKGLPAADLTEEAVRRLESYTFPNNIKVPPAGSSLLKAESVRYLFMKKAEHNGEIFISKWWSTLLSRC